MVRLQIRSRGTPRPRGRRPRPRGPPDCVTDTPTGAACVRPPLEVRPRVWLGAFTVATAVPVRLPLLSPTLTGSDKLSGTLAGRIGCLLQSPTVDLRCLFQCSAIEPHAARTACVLGTDSSVPASESSRASLTTGPLTVRSFPRVHRRNPRRPRPVRPFIPLRSPQIDRTSPQAIRRRL